MNENEENNVPVQPATPPAPIAAPIQPPPTPVQSPAPPVAPAQSPIGPDYSVPKSNNAKIFILIGAIVGGLVLLGIIGWVVYSSLFAVTKEDYRNAVEVVNGVSSPGSQSYSDVLKISYISSYATATSTENDIADAKKSLEAYKAANVKFKDLKALRDKDVKVAYDKYMDRYNAFVGFTQPYIVSAEKAIPAVLECEDLSSASVTDATSFKAAITPCKNALEDAKDVADKDLKTFIAAYLEHIEEMTDIVDEAAKLAPDDYTKRSALRTQLYDETEKLQDAQKDVNSNIEKRLKAVNPRETYNNFGNVLEDKQR